MKWGEERIAHEGPAMAGPAAAPLSEPEYQVELRERSGLPAGAVRFIDLTPRCCPFPLGEPEDGAAMACCGAPKPVGRPYCRRHMAVAYVGGGEPG